jgi:hypothetical protein
MQTCSFKLRLGGTRTGSKALQFTRRLDKEASTKTQRMDSLGVADSAHGTERLLMRSRGCALLSVTFFYALPAALRRMRKPAPSLLSVWQIDTLQRCEELRG